MATIANLVAKLVLNTSGIKAGVQEATRDLKGLQSSVGQIGTAIKGFFALEAVRIGMDVIRTGVSIFNNLRASIDETSKSARKLGLTFQELRELKLTASLGGIDEAGLSTGLKQMQNRIAEASAGKGEAADTLGRLGLDPDQLKAAGPIGALKEIADALQGVENEADRVQIAMDLFGRQGVDMLSMMENGAAGLQAQLDQAGGILGNMSDEDAAAVEGMNDNLERLWAGLKANAEIGLGKLSDDLAQSDSRATMLARTLGFLPALAANYWSEITGAWKEQEEAAKRSLELDKKLAELPTTAAGNKRRENEERAKAHAHQKELNAATEAGVKIEEQLASKLQSITEGDFAAKLASWTNAATKAGMDPSAIEAQAQKLRELNQEVEAATARQKEMAEAAKMVEDAKTAWDDYAETLGKINRYAAQGLIPEQAQNRLADQAKEKLRSSEGLSPTKTAAEEYSSSIDKFNRGLAAGVVTQAEFNRLVDEARKKYDEMAERENPLVAKAKALGEELRTPIEKLDQQMREIDQMVAGGLLGKDLAKRARDQALGQYAEQAKIPTVRERPTALGRYTEEGYNAAYAEPIVTSQDQLRDLAQQQLDEHRKTNKLLEGQQKAGPGGFSLGGPPSGGAVPSAQEAIDALQQNLDRQENSGGGAVPSAAQAIDALQQNLDRQEASRIEPPPVAVPAGTIAGDGGISAGSVAGVVEQLLRQIAEQHLAELKQHTGYLQKLAAANEPKVATIGR